MVSFHEVRFPADISFKAKGGPEFRTEVVSLASGQEKRNISWQNARAKYELGFDEISKSQANKLLAFFMARRGRAYGFRFKDWNDFEAKTQVLGTGNSIKTQFNLIKNYEETETEIYTRRINKPVTGTVAVYANSTLLTNGFSIDIPNGIINFSTPPASSVIISASFEFDVPVRFDSDSLYSEVKSYGKNSVPKIEFIEVRN